MSEYRNQNGTFGEMGGTVGNHSWVSTTDQSAAGINSLDSAATSAIKMDAYAQQQRLKNQQYNTPYVGNYSGGGGASWGPNVGKNFLYLIFLLGMLYFMGGAILGVIGYNKLEVRHEKTMELSDPVINAQAVMRPEGSNQEVSVLRAEFETRVATFLYKNPAIIKQMWTTCGENCIRPSTRTMLKYLPYVEPATRQYYLMQVCETPGKFPLGHATLQATPQGCVITNYEEMKRTSLIDQRQSGQAFKNGFSTSLMELIGFVAIFLAGTVFYIKKRE